MATDKDGWMIAGTFGVGCVSIVVAAALIGSAVIPASAAMLVIVGAIFVFLLIATVIDSKGKRAKVLLGGGGMIALMFGPAILWLHFHPNGSWYDVMQNTLGVALAITAIAGWIGRRRKARAEEEAESRTALAAAATTHAPVARASDPIGGERR